MFFCLTRSLYIGGYWALSPTSRLKSKRGKIGNFSFYCSTFHFVCNIQFETDFMVLVKLGFSPNLFGCQHLYRYHITSLILLIDYIIHNNSTNLGNTVQIEIWSCVVSRKLDLCLNIYSSTWTVVPRFSTYFYYLFVFTKYILIEEDVGVWWPKQIRDQSFPIQYSSN